MKLIFFLFFILINLNFIFSDTIYRHNDTENFFIPGFDPKKPRYIYFNVDYENRSLIRNSNDYYNLEEGENYLYGKNEFNKHYKFEKGENGKSWLTSNKCEISFKNENNRKYFTANFNFKEANGDYLNYLKKNYNNLLESEAVAGSSIAGAKKYFTGKQILESNLWMKVA